LNGQLWLEQLKRAAKIDELFCLQISTEVYCGFMGDYLKRHIEAYSHAFIEDIKSCVRKNGRVVIKNFGTFKLVKRRAHSKRLPTGKMISVIARTAVKFVPSKNFLATS
jgi:nucleoid DNA-binding protein